ncbi:YidC/Oxa1 family membrane protein insertase [Candidatus Saccharibacteria bacterium]|nr:YidC/Oxa1 family membrane protein insertase [Candidatus Saccharibacteria bacterium]
MNIFDLLILQPIFNLLIFIYGVIPGSDFGIALIIFTVIVRLLMWPLIKKQLHQTKLQRAIQPELKKIKAKSKGDKTLEGQLMLELYREKGIKPMSSIGILFLQLPIFIALFSVVRIITVERDKVAAFSYGFLEQIGPIKELINNPDNFNESLLGIVNLAKTAVTNEGIYWPLIILALLAAVLQFFQTRQISPQPTEHKRLRDVVKAQAAGSEVDPSEISAIMMQRMNLFFPLMTFMVMIYLPGAISLYTVVSSIVAVIQQHILLGRDVDEMQALVSESTSKDAQKRVDAAIEAELVTEAGAAAAIKPRGKKRSKRKDT